MSTKNLYFGVDPVRADELLALSCTAIVIGLNKKEGESIQGMYDLAVEVGGVTDSKERLFLVSMISKTMGGYEAESPLGLPTSGQIFVYSVNEYVEGKLGEVITENDFQAVLQVITEKMKNEIAQKNIAATEETTN